MRYARGLRRRGGDRLGDGQHQPAGRCSIGVALLSTITATAIADKLGELASKPTPADILAADVHGYTTAFYWAGAIFVLAAVCAFTLLRSHSRPAPATAPAQP